MGKSDVWATGAVAYEVFGSENPFYASTWKHRERVLDSRVYQLSDLPRLPAHVPAQAAGIVQMMLHRDPTKRPSAAVTANMLHLLLWAPGDWFTNKSPHDLPVRVKVMRWLLTLTAGVVCERLHQVDGKHSSVETQLKSAFLSRLNLDDVLEALERLNSL